MLLYGLIQMSKTISLLIALILLTACHQEETEERIVCDKYTTDWVYIANVYEGIIRWRTSRDSTTYYRKMLPAEICHKESRIII